jgi:hypothetical protein
MLAKCLLHNCRVGPSNSHNTQIESHDKSNQDKEFLDLLIRQTAVGFAARFSRVCGTLLLGYTFLEHGDMIYKYV